MLIDQIYKKINRLKIDNESLLFQVFAISETAPEKALQSF